MKNLKNSAGFTLIELFATLLIGSIVILGGVRIFMAGIREFNKATSRMQMLNEGLLAMRQMEDSARDASFIYLTDTSSPDRARATMTIPGSGIGSGEVEYFVNRLDKTLRTNDHRVNFNNLNVPLLPRESMQAHHGDGRVWPYRVKSLIFKYGDEDYSEYNIDTNQGEFILKINLVLEDDLGNEISLNSYQSRFN